MYAIKCAEIFLCFLSPTFRFHPAVTWLKPDQTSAKRKREREKRGGKRLMISSGQILYIISLSFDSDVVRWDGTLHSLKKKKKNWISKTDVDSISVRRRLSIVLRLPFRAESFSADGDISPWPRLQTRTNCCFKPSFPAGRQYNWMRRRRRRRLRPFSRNDV